MLVVEFGGPVPVRNGMVGRSPSNEKVSEKR